MAPQPLSLYRGLLRAAKYYPSKNRSGVAEAIREEFRAKKDVSGAKLEEALWLGMMELERLRAWVPTAQSMGAGDDDFEVKL